MTQMRKDFEKWLKPLIGSYFNYDLTFSKDAEDRYTHSRVQALWMAFAAGYDAAP